MRELKYNSKQTLRLDYPPDWDPSKITGMSLAISDVYGTALLSATDLSLWLDTKRPFLSVAADQNDNTITLGASIAGVQTTDSIVSGDILRIDSGASGPPEEVIVDYAAAAVASVRIVGLTRDLRHAHAYGTNVYGAFVRHLLDTTTTTTWTLGRQIVITWTPTLITSTATGTTGTISAFADYSGTVPGTTKATCATHGLITGNEIKIMYTSGYNGTYTITKIDANSFYFTKAYSVNDARGTWYLTSILKAGTGVTERGEVVADALVDAGFTSRFELLFPREYEAATRPKERLTGFYDEARRQLRAECMLRGLDIDRLVDQDALDPSLVQKVRWLILQSGDDRYDAERAVCQAEYARQFDVLCKSPIWQDSDQDRVEEDEEFEDHSSFGFERGL